MPTPFVPVASVFDDLRATPTLSLVNGTTKITYTFDYAGKIVTGNADGSAQALRFNLRKPDGSIGGISGQIDPAEWNAYVDANGIDPSEKQGAFPAPITLSPSDAQAVSAHPSTAAPTPDAATHVVVKKSLWEKVKDLAHEIEAKL